MIKINKNTDSVDIDQKCIGLSATRSTFPSDVATYINSNRGLHIQIRHNKDPQTFDQANSIASLIAAAPDLLEASKLLLYRLEVAQADLEETGDASFDCNDEASALKLAIKKAEGDKS